MNMRVSAVSTIFLLEFGTDSMVFLFCFCLFIITFMIFLGFNLLLIMVILFTLGMGTV